MRISTRAIVALLCTAAAAPAIAQGSYGSAAPQQKTVPQQATEQPESAQGANQIRPSKGALKALVELQKAVEAKDAANIPPKLAAAQAVASTREDRYIVAQLQLKAAADANDVASVSTAVDAMAATGLVDGPKLARLYRGIGGSYYNTKQYGPAAAAYERAVALDQRDVDALTMLAEARNGEGRKAEAVSGFQRAIQASLSAGQKPREELYKRAVSLAYETKAANATKVAREWVAAYPSPSNWHDAVAIYRNLGRPDVEGTLTMLRLLRAAGAMTTPGDYALYATAAADQLNFNEAQAVIDEGIAAGKVDPASAQFKDIIPPLRKKPKATAADLADAAKNAQSGMALLRIGDRYYALHDYAKAVDLYKKATGRPGVDPDLANLHIGFALAAAGDKAGATQAFNAVKGSRADIAQFWLLYLQSKA